MEKKLFMVETISVFRHRYVVEAYEAEHAAEEVSMNTSGATNENFTEFSQKHISEEIISVRHLAAKDYLDEFDADNPYLSSWSIAQKMNFINTIKYNDE